MLRILLCDSYMDCGIKLSSNDFRKWWSYDLLMLKYDWRKIYGLCRWMLNERNMINKSERGSGSIMLRLSTLWSCTYLRTRRTPEKGAGLLEGYRMLSWCERCIQKGSGAPWGSSHGGVSKKGAGLLEDHHMVVYPKRELGSLRVITCLYSPVTKLKDEKIMGTYEVSRCYL